MTTLPGTAEDLATLIRKRRTVSYIRHRPQGILGELGIDDSCDHNHIFRLLDALRKAGRLGQESRIVVPRATYIGGDGHGGSVERLVMRTTVWITGEPSR